MTRRRSIALVEDHALISRGFKDLVQGAKGLALVATVETVDGLRTLETAPDLVVLDLRLADGSKPEDNVAAILAMGAHVLIYTGADDRRLIQSAARSGALGLVRKSADAETLLDAIRTAAEGGEVFSVDWAAAIDADDEFPDARLAPREREILRLYASGETAVSVAKRLGISKETVSDHIGRVRQKYINVGRAAHTKVDLYVRAIEDGIVDGPS